MLSEGHHVSLLAVGMWCKYTYCLCMFVLNVCCLHGELQSQCGEKTLLLMWCQNFLLHQLLHLSPPPALPAKLQTSPPASRTTCQSVGLAELNHPVYLLGLWEGAWTNSLISPQHEWNVSSLTHNPAGQQNAAPSDQWQLSDNQQERVQYVCKHTRALPHKGSYSFLFQCTCTHRLS